jgi:hypothetical protein
MRRRLRLADGKFGVFIPDFQEAGTSPYFRKLREDGWEDWFKGGSGYQTSSYR